MTIQDGDIQILASKVMDDVPEGGGGPTGKVIEWGKSNQIFDDITEVARAGGQVSIRQLHAAVTTGDTEPLLDATIIVDQLPTDPNVSVTLAACSTFAQRSEIATSIADYLIAGTEWNGILLGNHVLRQANIQIFHRVGTSAPAIGRTLLLVQNEGQSTERRQYVRITRTDTVERTFTFMSGATAVDYKALVTVCDLSGRLDFAFTGSEPNRAFTREANAARIRDTTVADAVQFYGASTLTAAHTLGDPSRQVKVSSIYTQLVPSSRTERVNLDRRPAAMRSITLAIGPREVTVPVAPHTYRFKVGQENRGISWTAILRPFPSPGTVVVSFRVLGTWYTCQDNGAGELVGDAVGSISYANGSIAVTLPAQPDVGSAIIFQWGETTGYVNRSNTLLQVRQPEYCLQLEHECIVPGTLEIAWPSNGVLKTATANAVGALSGDASGEVNLASGKLLIKPAQSAWIDAQGEFHINYEYVSVVTQNVSASPDAAGYATLSLDAVPAAGSVKVKWVTVRNVTASSGGSSAGAASGKGDGKQVNALMDFLGNVVPQVYMSMVNADRQATYTQQTTSTSKTQELQTHVLTDDGLGTFGERGSANYAGKSLTVKLIDLDAKAEGYQTTYEGSLAFENVVLGGGLNNSTARKGGESTAVAVSEQLLAASTVEVTYATGFASPLTAVQSWQPPAVAIDLCPYTAQYVVPGSVLFTWMGHTYLDVDGDIIRDRTGSSPGVVAGRMDYEAGIAYLWDYGTSNTALQLVLQSLWTTRKGWTTGSIYFRTDAAPVAVQGLTLNLSDAAGNAITLTPDLEGYFNTTQSRGRMDYESGLTEIQFGAFVTAADLTDAEKAEWWYDAAEVGEVQAGKIWKPLPVDPTTLRFNAVTYVYLPLDADIIKMDPVRLPSDGRVPVFRNGYYVVVGHTGSVPKATLSNGQTIDCARTRLSYVWVVGADGEKIQTGWSADLDAGEVNIEDITGWAQPVQVFHRIEEMARVTDVQINGTLTLTKALSHDFPVGSVVSSALYAGTIRARVSHLFDQGTLDGVSWSDTVQGNVAAGTYNDTVYPVEVTNAGAITERWMLRFKSTGQVEVVGEHVGNLGTFAIVDDIAPLNPNTRTDDFPGMPYFTLRAGGWGDGWPLQSGLRINTVGAQQAFSCIRTVQPSEAAGTDYSFGILTRGDIDRAG